MSESVATRSSADEALPGGLVAGVLVLTGAPVLLNALGAFGDLGASAGLVHSLLEWTCVCIALFTFALGILAWIARPDPLVFIISLALLLSGISDSVHTMTTSGLVGYSGRFEDFVQWSGAVGRMFRALVLTFGAAYLLSFHHENRIFSWPRLAALAVPGAILVFALQWSSLLGNVPESPLPGNFSVRPWDEPLLFLIVVSGIIFVPVIRRRPSLLAKAMLLASVPETAVGLHYAVGTSSLYDASFFSAHALKILSSLIPLSAVSLHLVRSYRREVAALSSMQELVESLEGAQQELRWKEERFTQLTRSIKEVFWIVEPRGPRDALRQPRLRGNLRARGGEPLPGASLVSRRRFTPTTARRWSI